MKQADESCLVRDPETGAERYVPTDRLTIAGASSLEKAARSVPEAVRQVIAGVPDERALGLLVMLDGEPRPVRNLIDSTDLCESDLQGRLGALQAAGLVVETTVHGERGYTTSEVATAGLTALD